MGRTAVLAVLLLGCGRVDFDPLRDTNAALPSGLVAWFPLDEAAAPFVDVIGGLQGTCAPTCPTSTPGHLAGALVFDGANACFEVADNGRLDLPAFTLAIWANQADTSHGSHLSKRVGASSDNSWQLENSTAMPLAVRFTTYHGNVSTTDATDNTIVLGRWQHVVGTWDGATKRIYVDGVLVGSAPEAAAIQYDTNRILVGCDDNGTLVEHFSGVLDDLQIYDRALPDAEIAALAAR